MTREPREIAGHTVFIENVPRPKPALRSLRRVFGRLTGTKHVERFGVRLCVDETIVPRSVCGAILAGTYELAEAELLQKGLKPGEKVLEIGTGVGFISLLAARLTGPQNVSSFEANDTLKPILDENRRLNDMAPDLTFKAVTKDGQPVVFYRDTNLVSSSIIDREAGATRVEVPAVAFSGLLASLEPDVIVMDVEGAEIDLLRDPLPAGVRALLVETHPHIVGTEATDEMIERLVRGGFVHHTVMHKNILFERERADG
ncbi:methyltransferase, FkbM family [Palleronia salina]|uniref:Methyltransferase, FkbM family n=1 Tax=Palleronia salina TaxID=313368 RepID=A0A1M6K675_9RHOB|nr:FkbM family methyltransferase [Palleronia salina]SHJ54471.1 methyltransferase, FkbM family [Palleronia salina]